MSKFTNLVPIWDSLPININWQIHHRDNDNFSLLEDKVQNIREGINISIILNTASMVEGYLEEKIRIIYDVQTKSKQFSEMDKRLRKKFIDDLINSNFDKYNDYYNLIVGKKINEILGSENLELWKDIGYLFKIRNIVAHSQSLQMEIDLEAGTETAADVQFIGKFKQILDHLVERSVNPDDFPEGTNFKSMFFNIKVANYFFIQGKEFILMLDIKLKELGIQSNFNLNTIFRNYKPK